jgi:type III pantothenate kinase
MIVSLDFGNSNPHVGFFENKKLEVLPLNAFLNSYNLKDNQFYASIVGQVDSSLNGLKIKRVNDFRNGNQFLDMPIHYSSGLGEDRLILGFYLFHQLKKSRTLIIDAGTFMTTDLITSDGFCGGYIFPGIKTFLKTYNQGSLLSSFDFQKSELRSLPQETKNAIIDAANIYIKSSLEHVIKTTTPDNIYITGGEGEIIKSFLTDLNLNFDLQPHLIHYALHELANYDGVRL